MLATTSDEAQRIVQSLENLAQATAKAVSKAKREADLAAHELRRFQDESTIDIDKLIVSFNNKADPILDEPVTLELLAEFHREEDQFKSNYNAALAQLDSLDRENQHIKTVVAGRVIRELGFNIWSTGEFLKLVAQYADPLDNKKQIEEKICTLRETCQQHTKAYQEYLFAAAELNFIINKLSTQLTQSQAVDFTDAFSEFGDIPRHAVKFVFAHWYVGEKLDRHNSPPALYFLNWLCAAAGRGVINAISNFLAHIADTGLTKVRLKATESSEFQVVLTSPNRDFSVQVPSDLEGVVSMLGAMGLGVEVVNQRGESQDILIRWS